MRSWPEGSGVDGRGASRWRRAYGLVVAAALAATSGACAVSPSPERAVSVSPERAVSASPERAVDLRRCAREAGLLAAPAEVRAAPSAASRMVTTLVKGAVVYACGTAEAGFVPVMFPQPGQRAVCASHPASCASGWIPVAATIDAAG